MFNVAPTTKAALRNARHEGKLRTKTGIAEDGDRETSRGAAGAVAIGSWIGWRIPSSIGAAADDSIVTDDFEPPPKAAESADRHLISAIRGQPGAAASTTSMANPATTDRASAIRRAG